MSPTLIFIPGSFSTSSMYDPIVLPLREKGYDIHVLDPPCYPANYKKGSPAPTMYDDAKYVSEYVEKFLDEKDGGDIVLLAHSYGGIPTSQSLATITRSSRLSAGKKGGVIHVAYMTAVVPAVGKSLATTMPVGEIPMGVDEDGYLYHTSPATTGAISFSSLPEAEGTALAASFGRHSAASFGGELTYSGYKDVGVSWFFCEEDKCVTPEVQETAIKTIEESWKGTEREGKKVVVTKAKCDHVPIYSAREEVIRWMEGLFAVQEW